MDDKFRMKREFGLKEGLYFVHVHKTKELDDNSPSKDDRKDPRVIAGLVKERCSR